ncbi:tRNA dimethylallyltransferase [Aspergillus homomorphus CBS 101889]|uniref:tRNA dimethylallyltransferase n=1 Tax=Aspergillus homomorphus (strain CBS 101889) TaxID=1450537 RepID=A0A395HIZ1_ASPHC|nr:tRNA isopentenyltransferase [Aspergillus homomorphus CBS 101889]RAL07740.1 tRNA isopentenyltransferase [Aspergillus homomorphus CBS 101889]
MRHLFHQLFSTFSCSQPVMKKPLIAVIGATGTGKSKLAVDLASRFNGEIINGDAMQMYRGLPIITNQIPLEERNGIPHHLLSCVEIEEEPWWIGRFKQESLRLIDQIHAKGKLPILVGGTHYYTQAVLFNDQLVDADQDSVNDVAVFREGNSDKDSPTKWPILDAAPEVVLQKLREVDPVMADRWHPNEARKIRRSLEIYLQTGRPASEVYTEQEQLKRADTARDDFSLGAGRLRYPTMIFWVHSEKQTLNARLEKRVGAMIDQGLMDEARRMFDFAQEKQAQGNPIDHTRGVWISIGYKELAPYFDAFYKGSMSPLELEALKQSCVDSIMSATRQYAMSQIKWIRNKLWRAVADADATNRLFILDSTNVEAWEEAITKPSEILVRALLNDEPTPDPKSLSDLARFILSAKEAQPQRDSTSLLKCMTCKVCNKIMQGEEQWEIHLNGNAHKRALKSAAKKAARDEYLRRRQISLSTGDQPENNSKAAIEEGSV